MPFHASRARRRRLPSDDDDVADASRLRGLPVRIVHGTQDWMFPPEIAQGAERALQQAGADVSYREIADLSHTYPRDENAGLLDWFLSKDRQ